MKLSDHLDKETKSKLNKVSRKKRKKRDENINFKELMGQYDPVYRRTKGGAYRQK
jgi:hypothetical protein